MLLQGRASVKHDFAFNAHYTAQKSVYERARSATERNHPLRFHVRKLEIEIYGQNQPRIVIQQMC